MGPERAEGSRGGLKQGKSRCSVGRGGGQCHSHPRAGWTVMSGAARHWCCAAVRGHESLLCIQGVERGLCLPALPPSAPAHLFSQREVGQPPTGSWVRASMCSWECGERDWDGTVSGCLGSGICEALLSQREHDGFNDRVLFSNSSVPGTPLALSPSHSLPTGSDSIRSIFQPSMGGGAGWGSRQLPWSRTNPVLGLSAQP